MARPKQTFRKSQGLKMSSSSDSESDTDAGDAMFTPTSERSAQESNRDRRHSSARQHFTPLRDAASNLATDGSSHGGSDLSGYSTSNSSREPLEQLMTTLQSQMAARRATVAENRKTTEDPSTSQADQVSDLTTATKDLREQLDAQTLTNVRLEAEIAASRTDTARTVAAYDTKLDTVMQMVKLQGAAFAAQQGHVANLDDALKLKIVTLENGLDDMKNSCDRQPDNKPEPNMDDTMAAVSALTNDFDAFRQTTMNGIIQLQSVAAVSRLPLTIAAIADQINSNISEESRMAYDTSTTTMLDAYVETVGSDNVMHSDCIQQLRSSVGKHYKLDEEFVRAFVGAVRKACFAEGERSESAATQELITAQAKRIDELVATAAELREQQTTEAMRFNKLAATTAELRKQKTTEAMRFNQLTATTAELREQRTADAKRIDELVATATELRAPYTAESKRIDVLAANETGLREQCTAGAEKAKATVSCLESELATVTKKDYAKHLAMADELNSALPTLHGEVHDPAIKYQEQVMTQRGQAELIKSRSSAACYLNDSLPTTNGTSPFTAKEQKLLVSAMLCYKTGPPAIDYVKFAKAGNFDTLEAAKETWASITRTAQVLAEYMDTETWFFRSHYSRFAEKWDKLIVIAMHCLYNALSGLDYIKFMLAANLDSPKMAQNVWRKIAAKLGDLAPAKYYGFSSHLHETDAYEDAAREVKYQRDMASMC
ncbi:hypothetical protein LTR08_005319 [Meristemomyces frigidus]|nr:hypothetical protein LTR08_005319 [Meristemomyces frigidus]